MSLAEIEEGLLRLPEQERAEFAVWFYKNQGQILPPVLADDEEDPTISSKVVEELILRREELDSGAARTFSVDEMSERVREALAEVHRSRR